jgi:hypothetical protein
MWRLATAPVKGAKPAPPLGKMARSDILPIVLVSTTPLSLQAFLSLSLALNLGSGMPARLAKRMCRAKLQAVSPRSRAPVARRVDILLSDVVCNYLTKSQIEFSFIFTDCFSNSEDCSSIQ